MVSPRVSLFLAHCYDSRSTMTSHIALHSQLPYRLWPLSSTHSSSQQESCKRALIVHDGQIDTLLLNARRSPECILLTRCGDYSACTRWRPGRPVQCAANMRLQYLLTKHRSDRLHERKIAEFLLVACREGSMSNSRKFAAQWYAPGTDHLPFFNMVSTASTMRGCAAPTSSACCIREYAMPSDVTCMNVP